MMNTKHDDWDRDDNQEDSTGIRRVNNWPLVIVMMVAICFVITMVSVMIHRSERPLSQANDQEHPSDSTTQAGRIVGQHHGFIQARMPMTEKNEVLPTPLPKATSSEMPGKDEQQAAREAELQELRIAKLEQIKSARQSKSSVPVTFDEGRRHSQNLPDVLQTLKSTLTPSNVIQNDPMALYQQTLRALQTSGILPKNTPMGEDPSASGYANNRYQAFDQSDDAQRWRLTSQLEAPDSRYQLRAGFVIPGLLISGINSDIPGQIVAQVAQSVYDTATGRYLLIPQGTRLVGSYASDINFGQERVLVAWQRLIFPDGKVLDLGAMPGADSAGYSGFVDQTNAHYLQLFGSAFLMSAVVAATSLSQLNANSSTGGYGQPTTAGVLNQSLGQQLGQVTAQLIAKNLNRAPTLEIRPGFRFNVIVTKDLTFHQPYRAFDYH